MTMTRGLIYIFKAEKMVSSMEGGLLFYFFICPCYHILSLFVYLTPQPSGEKNPIVLASLLRPTEKSV